jgi:LPS-assembly lipoprotein
MSLLNRRALLLVLPLAACGFTPAFGPTGGARDVLGAVEIAPPSTRFGFDLVKALELRLGRPKGARYDLAYTINTTTVSLGVTPLGDITRYNLMGSVDWTLTQKADGKVLAKGRVENFTAWSATGSTAAGLTAETDAGSRLMRIFADQIITNITSAAAAGWPM